MCGIVGYKGKNNPKEFLLEGLKNLEYRGYDSAGLALKKKNDIQIIRSIGKIACLEEKLNKEKLIDANMGIAHTRWATHGEPSVSNAHPHCVGRVTLVHNGIIENASELKVELKKDGYLFNSETDTEVAAALIDRYYDKDPILAIEMAIKKIKGSYAFGILFKDSDKLYAVRKDSPLIIGYGDDEVYIASDIAAIINYTKQYSLLDENEIVEIGDAVKVTKDGKEIEKEIFISTIEAGSNDKGGFEHYMLKEIMEEPVVLEKTLRPYLADLDKLPDLSEYEEIHIVACGSAMYAGMIGKTLLEEKAMLRVTCEVASEYRYKKVLYDRKTLVILISQSGETADTIAAMRKAKLAGIETLAIVNVVGSTIARESGRQIFIEAGAEIAVATTKAYMLQVAILSLLAYKAALAKGYKNGEIVDDAKKLPGMIREILDRIDDYKKVAQEIYEHSSLFFIGRKIDYAVSLEGSLKLKEVSYIHSEAYQAGELKHGTISLIDENVPVIAIITDKDIKEKSLSNVQEVKARGAKCIIISNEEISGYDYLIKVRKVSDFFQPLLVVPCLQLIAYEVARLRGCDIDKPKNLAKSVTVE